MPDVQEVFRMATQKVRPDPGALGRQQRKQRWHMGKEKAAVYALVAGLVIAGIVIGISTLGDTGTTPAGTKGGLTREQLAGVWKHVEGPFSGPAPLLSFGTDGTFAIDNGGALDQYPTVAGTYRLQGNMIVMTNRGSFGCPDGDVAKWRAAPPQEGRLRFVIVQSGTGSCAVAVGGEFTAVRIAPRSPASVDLTSGGQAEEGVHVSLLRDLAGIWLLDGGDHLLRIALDGSYAIADAGTLVTSPHDVGTVQVEDDGTLTFTSGPESRTCPEGTMTVWRDATVHLDALAADVDEGACGDVPPGRTSWLMMSRRAG